MLCHSPPMRLACMGNPAVGAEAYGNGVPCADIMGVTMEKFNDHHSQFA